MASIMKVRTYLETDSIYDKYPKRHGKKVGNML